MVWSEDAALSPRADRRCRRRRPSGSLAHGVPQHLGHGESRRVPNVAVSYHPASCDGFSSAAAPRARTGGRDQRDGDRDCRHRARRRCTAGRRDARSRDRTAATIAARSLVTQVSRRAQLRRNCARRRRPGRNGQDARPSRETHTQGTISKRTLMTPMTSSASEQAWAMIDQEKRRERFLRRINVAAWTLTFVVVAVFGIISIWQLVELMHSPLFAGGLFPTSTLFGALYPLLVVLGVLAVLIATLSTIGIFLRLRTASLIEIQLRLAALEELLTRKPQE